MLRLLTTFGTAVLRAANLLRLPAPARQPLGPEEWRTSGDPAALLEALLEAGTGRDGAPAVRPGVRQLRLFGCACCRRVLSPVEELAAGMSRRLDAEAAERAARQAWDALETAERYADGAASEDERARAERRCNVLCADAWGIGLSLRLHALQAAVSRDDLLEPRPPSPGVIFSVCRYAALSDTPFIGLLGAFLAPDRRAAAGSEASAQADLLRDIVGDPFRPCVVEPAWSERNGGVVRRLAQAIYDERAFDRLPVLADALEDAGCDDAEVLGHCRRPGVHVRGCWVVDGVLGRS
jgi:hypothetical protein